MGCLQSGESARGTAPESRGSQHCGGNREHAPPTPALICREDRAFSLDTRVVLHLYPQSMGWAGVRCICSAHSEARLTGRRLLLCSWGCSRSECARHGHLNVGMCVCVCTHAGEAPSLQCQVWIEECVSAWNEKALEQQWSRVCAGSPWVLRVLRISSKIRTSKCARLRSA